VNGHCFVHGSFSTSTGRCPMCAIGFVTTGDLVTPGTMPPITSPPSLSIRERHRAVGNGEDHPVASGFCAVCNTPWPCDYELQLRAAEAPSGLSIRERVEALAVEYLCEKLWFQDESGGWCSEDYGLTLGQALDVQLARDGDRS